MKATFHRLMRYGYAVIALALLSIMGLMPFLSSQVGATGSGGLLEPRSIQLSNATPGATGVQYLLKFTPVTTESAGALIVDFCSDTPLIGATCAYSNATTPVVSSATASTGTISFPGSAGHTILVTGLTLTAGTPFSITFSNITNPSGSAGSFYARILTYATGNGSTYVPASTSGGTTTPGTYVDWGGDALSTSQVVTVTASVMEQLTFCDSGSTITTCSSTTAPSITLGHGGPPAVLTSTAVDGASVYAQTSTNALNGVSVNMKTTSSTACGGLSSNGGTSCGIPAVNTGSGVPAAATITAGTAAVGMCVNPSAGTTATAPYNGTCTNGLGAYASNSYGMNDSTNGGFTNLFSPYGSTILTSSGPLNAVNDQLTFAATSALTTPAGIYTANYTLIATGTF